jgi:serine/threonine-protein kinase
MPHRRASRPELIDFPSMKSSSRSGHGLAEATVSVHNDASQPPYGFQPGLLRLQPERHMHSSSPALHPEQIGNYKILERLGAGGMGVVYKALDLKLDRTVALKFLAEQDPLDRERLLREARAASALDHLNVGTVYTVEETGDQQLFIVMAFYDGENLAQRLRHGALDREQSINIATQVARGLLHAHAHGVVHRDIKPSNVILTSDGVAKIVDFGVAQRFSASATTQSGSFSGTFAYMSPEQTQGQSVDARSDIWSWGVLLHLMMTGELPFFADNASAMMMAILHLPPKAAGTLPEELQVIVYRALAKDPVQRYQSCADLLRDLEKLEPGSPERTASVTHRRLEQLRLAASAAATGTRGSRALNIAALLALIAALVATSMLAWRRGRVQPPSNRPVHSIAVLPLANLSGNRDQEYFSEGMTDALITELSQIQALNVVSRTSVQQYAGGTKTVPQIAKELQVDAVIEGSVQQVGSRVAISLNLRDAADHPLRAIRMEREMRDVLALERDVARSVAEDVKVSLTNEEQRRLSSAPPVDPAAHEAYLMGEYLAHGSHEQRRNAKSYFEKAIAMDPGYAPAYAGLADFYWAMAEIDPREAMPLARSNAIRALELDPQLAKAHTTLASIYFYADFNWQGADEEYRRALDLFPNDPDGHAMYSVFLAAMGRSEESLAHARRYQELERISSRTRVISGWNLYYGRQYRDSVAQCRGALEMDPNNANAFECMGSSYIGLGESAKAVEACSRAIALAADSARQVCLGRAYALAHRDADARRILAELLETRKKSYVPACFLAELEAALGSRDEALAWLDKAYDEHDRYLAWLKVDEGFDPLRSDPRFQSVLRKVGLAR